MRQPRENPLLKDPPKFYHRVSDESRITRHGWDEPHLGVHTSTEENIAAGYAYSAFMMGIEKGTVPREWPVVVSLDVAGLTPEPDVDALLWWYDRGGKEQAKEILQEGEVPDSYDAVETDYGSVLATLINDININWSDVLEDPRMTAFLEPAIAGNHEAIAKILLAGFPQRRYMNNFDLDRVVEIRSFQPWYDEPLKFDDDELPPKLQSAEERGWMIYSRDDLLNFHLKWKSLYKGLGRQTRTRRPDFHGTTSYTLFKAFPELYKDEELPNPYGNIWNLKALK